MTMERETIGEVILKEVYDNSLLVSKTPTVLSCGGIYIPHKREENYVLYHILTTPSKNEPVKVVTGARPKNILFDLLARESMN